MDNFLIYIIKANITLTILFIIYWSCMRNETYLAVNRFFLIFTVIIALILPSIKFPIADILTESPIRYIAIEQFFSSENDFIYNSGAQMNSSAGAQGFEQTSFSKILLLYLSGVFLSIIFSLRRFRRLLRIIYKKNFQKLNDMKIINSEHCPSPFSFFNFVVINRDAYSRNEIMQIIAHEGVHYRQRHSIDLLFFEMSSVFFWFNPLIYIMAAHLRQIHEFLADRATLYQGFDKKAYQFLILKQSIGQPVLSVVNTFASSQTKRRIFMLNRYKSSHFAKLKIMIVVPVLILLFSLFNVHSIASDIPIHAVSPLEFGLPVREGKVTQKFAMGINPFTKKEVFHKGMDIAAPRGTNIYAAEEGIVLYADSLNGHGNKIVLLHADGYTTHYSHLYTIMISKDEKVSKGQIIGLVGSTGLSTAPHLHFEIRKDGEALDPSEYLDFSSYGNK